MSFTKIDSYLSYQLKGNQLKIRITDKYFSPYRVITDVLALLDNNNIGEEKAWKKLREELYNTSRDVKSFGIAFPLALSIFYKNEEFIIS